MRLLHFQAESPAQRENKHTALGPILYVLQKSLNDRIIARLLTIEHMKTLCIYPVKLARKRKRMLSLSTPTELSLIFSVGNLESFRAGFSKCAAFLFFSNDRRVRVNFHCLKFRPNGHKRVFWSNLEAR